MRILKVLVFGWLVGALFVLVLSAATRTERVVAKAVAVPVARSVPSPGPSAVPSPASGREWRAAPGESLPAGLLIPVAGITADALHDNFDQARGGNTRRHGALDIMAARGTPVIASVDGTIRKLFNSRAGGLTIYEFDDAEERVYYYAHLDRYADGVVEGMRVARGTVIGYVGSTGNARYDAPHLHFAIELLPPTKEWWGGTPINPYPLLMQ